ncbi:MAG TPA: hypothetical protein VHP38_09690 [Ruminiclostridium sp.]|nr:hypothetical protein [Ruminiclostridium sp.]
MYRLIECDSIEMFADRGVYLCVSTSTLYDNMAFNYDKRQEQLPLIQNMTEPMHFLTFRWT